MSPCIQLSSIIKEKYKTRDGKTFKAVLNVGLTEKEIEVLAKHLAVPGFPQEIHKLLRMASGFEFYGLDEIRFDRMLYGYEDLFPRAVKLTEDDFGNIWVVDIDRNGNWGSVFYVSHEPTVVVKQSENIEEFIKHIDEFGKLWQDSTLEAVHDKAVLDIWNRHTGLIASESAKYSRDAELRNFALSLPDNCLIGDLRKKPVQSGFVWGGFASRMIIRRHESEYLWAFHKTIRKPFKNIFAPALHRTAEFGRAVLSMKLIKNPVALK